MQAVQSEYVAEGGEGGSDRPSAAELHAVFVSLVKAHYVERVPPCTLPPLPKEVRRMAGSLARSAQACQAATCTGAAA